MYRETSGLYYDVSSSLMQQRDGDHIKDVFIWGDQATVPLGRMCYKISPATLTVTDSLFVADTVRHVTLLARDPRGEGNIRAVFEYHWDCDSSFVRISRFPDDDLHANPDEDVLVPVCEGDVWAGDFGSLVDRWGDLVMTYYRERPEGNWTYDQYIARIGLDGTLKCQAMLSENLMGDLEHLRVLKESPLQYYQWHEVDLYPNDNLAVYVIDSLFNKNTVILNKILHSESIGLDSTIYEYLGIDDYTDVVPAGGDDILVAAIYTYDTNFWALSRDFGVAVAKYDLRTMQLKGYTVFNDYHWFGSIGRPMGLKKMEDGTVYFIYKEHGYPDESVVIVKMDTDLNVEWKRFCKTGNINIFSHFNPPVVYEGEAGEEKGVTWCGYAYKDGNNESIGWVYFLLNHDGTVGINECGVEVRPYCFFPNPARDELHLQYSPDVQPARIELYDLQGRLIQTQTHGLECLRLEGLAAGQYLMKVSMKDGKTFTDKVVKE